MGLIYIYVCLHFGISVSISRWPLLFLLPSSLSSFSSLSSSLSSCFPHFHLDPYLHLYLDPHSHLQPRPHPHPRPRHDSHRHPHLRLDKCLYFCLCWLFFQYVGSHCTSAQLPFEVIPRPRLHAWTYSQSPRSRRPGGGRARSAL